MRLTREGLVIGGEPVPLYAGSVHYWRLDPHDWRACLTATRDLGFKLVDTYVPWAVHEVAPGVLELGETNPSLDVARFLRIAHELGLYAIVRPGPHINAELTYFGIPERVVWDPACQARSPEQNPVVLPMLPRAFPVPSYASEVFLDETARYFEAIGKALAPLLYPDGPIVMLQVDNEGAMYFRDGAYDQDYHPDALALYRAFLRNKYPAMGDLARAYGHDEAAAGAPRLGEIQPPTRFDAEVPGDLARHIDWAEFHEHLLARAMQRFAESLSAGGLDGVPRSHNFPPGQEATPLNAARVGGAVDVVGYDYYGKASPVARTLIARRTTELSVRSDALDVPAFACEMGAGFPPFFPPLDERDSTFTVMAALAYGVRGFNAYMAVERDRWIGAPIDPRGRERPFATFWRRLLRALDVVRFPSLRRRTPVRIVTPRNERRLVRVMHAFGPISGAFFSVLGASARESCFEDDLGCGYAPAIEADQFVRTLESALEARGVPFAHVGGEDRDISLEGAAWIVGVTSGGLSPALFDRLADAAARGAAVTLGPRSPDLGGARRPLKSPRDLGRLASASGLPPLCPADPASVEALVGDAVAALDLPLWAVEPDSVFATVHEDASGAPRVLFLLNPTKEETVARVTVGAAVLGALDLLKDQVLQVREGVLEVALKARRVRMIALDA